jgi:hypothetical protein
MKPEPFARISFCSRIGSPAINGERAIALLNSSTALGRDFFWMRCALAESAGQACQPRSPGCTALPSAISFLATST